MNPKKDVQQHEFGRKLEQLLLSVNIKNATIASALSYDVSYISKWISGKAFPSRKNIEGILTEISSLVVEQASEKAYGILQKYYGAKDRSGLQEAITNSLRNAYYETIGEVNETTYSSNASVHVLPRGKFPSGCPDYKAQHTAFRMGRCKPYKPGRETGRSDNS